MKYINGDAIKQNLRAVYIITKTEAKAHLMSARMVVLMIIFILSVLGGAYAFASLSTGISDIDEPEYLVWTFFINEDSRRIPNDALVYTTDLDGRPLSGVDIRMYELDGATVAYNTTGADGRAVFFNINYTNLIDCEKSDYEINYRPIILSLTQLSQLEGNLDLYTQVQSLDLDKDNVRDDVAIIVLDSDFGPIQNAAIAIPQGSADPPYTNSYGISKDFNLTKGKHEYAISAAGNKRIEEVETFSDDSDIENLLDLKGPDDVLMTVASLFIGLVVPIMAIGISFDTVSREKISKSIIFLLCRPIGKRAIAVGKFLGSVVAVSIPLTLVSLISVWVISAKTNEAPDGTFVAGFIVLTIIFLAIFVLLQQIFSTLAKTTGTAILAGIGIWLFYFLFFGLIILAISSMLGYQFMSEDYFILANQLSMFSPSSIYAFLISAVSPTGSSEFLGIPSWAPAAANFIWFAVLFMLAMEVFRKRPYL